MGNSSSSNDHKLSPETQKQLQIDQSTDILNIDVDKQLEEKQGIVFYAKYKTFPHFYFWSCNVARPPGSSSSDDDKSNENKKDDPTTTTTPRKISSDDGDVLLKCKIGVDDGRKEEEIPYTVDLWMKQDLKDGNYHVKPAPINDSEFNRRFAQQIPESLQKRWFGQMEITENQVQKMMKKRERQLAKQAAAAAAQEQKMNNSNNNNASSSLQQNQVMRAPIPAGIAESKQREDQRNSKNPSSVAASSIKKQVQRCHEVPQGLFQKGFVIGPKKTAMKIIEEYLPPSSLSSETSSTSSKNENKSDPQKQNKNKVVAVSEKYWNADNFSDFTMLTWIVDEMNLQRNSRQSYSNPLEKLRQHLNDDD